MKIKINRKNAGIGLLAFAMASFQYSPAQNNIITEQTPSRSEYFSWINNTNEGSTEAQTLANLDFFEWLKRTYGMHLDIYAFDSGIIDGKNIYGTTDCDRFRRIFPRGLRPIADKAAANGTRLGLWGGPDGFGTTASDAEKRTEMLVGLCRDYNWALFKFDAVCGPLREEKEDYFIEMMKRCREYTPDLILLNHRLGLKRASECATTFLWEGQESYTDVNSYNSSTAPHSRAGAMARGLVPGMKRLTEDHGVCLSSCMDFWDDELVIHAFGRSLILAPQIYGNPWLLSDKEFGKLAMLFNLHRENREILTEGIVLPESYGQRAVARGNGSKRFIVLRNLSWTPKEVTVSLSEEIGLDPTNKSIMCNLHHPEQRVAGPFRYGDRVDVTVPSFRSVLLEVSGAGDTPVSGFKKGKRSLKYDAGYSFLGIMSGCEVPEDADALYEATVFAADNNALEVRSLMRAGATSIPEVQNARDAFFNQDAFIGRGIWDHYLFDDDPTTIFRVSQYKFDHRINGGCLRVDFGKNVDADSIIIRVSNDSDLLPMLRDEGQKAYVSANIRNWKEIEFLSGLNMKIPVNGKVRYLRLPQAPLGINGVEIYSGGEKQNPESFRASNLYADHTRKRCVKAWKKTVRLNEVPSNARLCVALEGKHGVEGAYAAIKCGDSYIGAPARATSYPANPWENVTRRSDSNYTYLFPVSDEMKGKDIEIYVLGYDSDMKISPNVHLVSYPDK